MTPKGIESILDAMKKIPPLYTAIRFGEGEIDVTNGKISKRISLHILFLKNRESKQVRAIMLETGNQTFGEDSEDFFARAADSLSDTFVTGFVELLELIDKDAPIEVVSTVKRVLFQSAPIEYRKFFVEHKNDVWNCWVNRIPSRLALRYRSHTSGRISARYPEVTMPPCE